MSSRGSPLAPRVILLVDDDPGIRSIAGTILRDAGYAVIEANDGLQAWMVFRRDPGAFRMLVAEVVMPRMPGTELAARVHELHPELPVVLMSGYTNADLFARGLVAVQGGLVTKPFAAGTLVTAVRRALGQQS